MDEEFFYEDESKKGNDDGFNDEISDFPQISDFSKWLEENERDCIDESSISSGEISDDLTKKAREIFGVRFLFPWQRAVVENVLDFSREKNGRGQTVILPTGAGKSLCFLLPAAVLPKPTLVFYPLLALMSDQKRRADKAGLESVIFRGGQNSKEREENFRKIESGAKLILANPEVLQNERLVSRIAQIGISHIAIDEAHCVSEWGDSFRPSYLEIGKIIRKIKPDCVTAFTATASPAVLSRIGEIVFPDGFSLVKGSCDRKNIVYRVEPSVSKMHTALVLAKKMKKPLLIFCSTRNRAEKMGKFCAEIFGENRARFYHAGMTKDEKTKIEDWFFNSADGILCATCAYGMGVDKSNIRSVLHLDASESIESFCQESGRAGRDGKKAESVLIWSREDKKSFLRKGNRSMVLYAEGEKCRREVLLSALDDAESSSTVCSGCDVCSKKIKRVCEEESEILRFVKLRKNVYLKSEAEEILTARFSKASIKKLGVCAWDENATKDAVSLLIDSKKIEEKPRLCIKKSKRPKRIALFILRRLRFLKVPPSLRAAAQRISLLL